MKNIHIYFYSSEFHLKAYDMIHELLNLVNSNRLEFLHMQPSLWSTWKVVGAP